MLGWVGYQHRQERISRSGFFAQSAMALMWLAWSFFQIAKGTSGGVEAVVELLAVGAFVAAIGVGVQWRRT
ncbi:hypothetical protein ACFQDG_06300 [Natronoarchaeum mannanilyticum]|uniref:Uncharacterized protein n=1 Tax=Natronoarchaeum mannanilyticum TaxID=926360 RepID=A0AAV3T852_9EURY